MPRSLLVRRLAQVLIVALPIFVGLYIVRKAVDLPYWDEWEWAGLVYSFHEGTLRFADLWAQHNEHRILVPNLIMLGLDRFGGWDPVREQFVSLAVLVVAQIGIVLLMRRSAHATVGIVAAAAASLMLYELGQAENFEWGFQMAWFICNTAAVLVALLLTKVDRRRRDVALAMTVAIIATYSSSQGILTWGVGIVAILLTFRKSALMLAVWIPAAIAAYAVYEHGLQPMNLGHVSVFQQPLQVVDYTLTYLGSPVAAGQEPHVSAVAGLILMVALAWAFASDVCSATRLRRLIRNAPWYSLAAYSIVCAAGTATGRAGFGIDQALSGRYISVSLLGWVALIGVIAGTVARLPRPVPVRTRAVVLASTAVFLFAVGSDDDRGLKNWRTFAATLSTARAQIARGDPAALSKVYPVPNAVMSRIDEMRAVHDGLFAGE